MAQGKKMSKKKNKNKLFGFHRSVLEEPILCLNALIIQAVINKHFLSDLQAKLQDNSVTFLFICLLVICSAENFLREA